MRCYEMKAPHDTHAKCMRSQPLMQVIQQWLHWRVLFVSLFINLNALLVLTTTAEMFRLSYVLFTDNSTNIRAQLTIFDRTWLVGLFSFHFLILAKCFQSVRIRRVIFLILCCHFAAAAATIWNGSPATNIAIFLCHQLASSWSSWKYVTYNPL